MYNVTPTNEMKRNTKQLAKRGKDMAKLIETIALLSTGNPMPSRYRDHALIGGKYKGCRECHIEPDWLLVYKKYDDALIIITTATGTHSDLFG